MSFSISKKYKNTCWTDLELLNEKNENWEKAILIIKDRFDSRFFSHIDLIKYDEFSGFQIMSIDCLLIETLMQFYLGVDNTEISYKNCHWKAFNDFFKNSKHFKIDFKTNVEMDEIWNTFYKHFRCGLLHQAQTKCKSRIKIFQPNFLELSNKNDIKEGLIIDRKLFHKKLVLEFEDYLQKLTDNGNNFKGENLRINAINKMNFICTE
jgi:hypothetical protein